MTGCVTTGQAECIINDSSRDGHLYWVVQTLVVGSESGVPEEEPKLLVKTDLGYRLDLKKPVAQKQNA